MPTTDQVREAFTRRAGPIAELDAEAIAGACRAMAQRFRRGGRLLAMGAGVGAADAAHVVVEFVHPVVVGKRALPAQGLPDGGSAASVALFGEPDDIALAFSADGGSPELAGALAEAARRGLLTVALVGGDGGLMAAVTGLDHLVVVPSSDPTVVREGHVTAYHVLWELVHVFLEAPDGR